MNRSTFPIYPVRDKAIESGVSIRGTINIHDVNRSIDKIKKEVFLKYNITIEDENVEIYSDNSYMIFEYHGILPNPKFDEELKQYRLDVKQFKEDRIEEKYYQDKFIEDKTKVELDKRVTEAKTKAKNIISSGKRNFGKKGDCIDGIMKKALKKAYKESSK